MARPFDVRYGTKPNRFHESNPYTIRNIANYCKLSGIKSILLEKEYINSGHRMEWKCLCGTTYYCSMNQCMSGKSMCNFCAKSKRHDGKRDYFNIVAAKCKELNYTLLTDSISRGSHEFQYICNSHSDSGIKTLTYDRMINQNHGCWECGVERRGIKHRRANEDKFREAVERMGFVYKGYSYDNSDTTRKKVKIAYVCSRHTHKGLQYANYDNLLRRAKGCTYCAGTGRTMEDLRSELNAMHNCIEVIAYTDYSFPVEVQCKKCKHLWRTSGISLTQGHMCPKCTRSHFEKEVMHLLDLWDVEYVCEHRFEECRSKRELPFDLFLTVHNIAIEMDGEHHYMPIRRGSMTDEDAEEKLKITQEHDRIKTMFCENNGIKLIRVPFWERNRLKDYLGRALTECGVISKVA